MQKIAEYNQKKGIGKPAKKLVNKEVGEEDEDESGTPKSTFKPITISDEGLELIEYISLDCTGDGPWHSDEELKIDKNGFVIANGEKTKTFWDGKITSMKMPLHMKVRNIAGDETVVKLI